MERTARNRNPAPVLFNLFFFIVVTIYQILAGLWAALQGIGHTAIILPDRFIYCSKKTLEQERSWIRFIGFPYRIP